MPPPPNWQGGPGLASPCDISFSSFWYTNRDLIVACIRREYDPFSREDNLSRTRREARNEQVGRHEHAKRDRATTHDANALGPSAWSFPVRLPPPCTAGPPPQPSRSPMPAAPRAHLRRPQAYYSTTTKSCAAPPTTPTALICTRARSSHHTPYPLQLR